MSKTRIKKDFLKFIFVSGLGQYGQNCPIVKSKVLSNHRIMSFVNKHFFMICSGNINILEGKLGMALAHNIL